MRGVTDGRTDRELLDCISAGDAEARGVFCRRHAAWSVDYARRRGAGEHSEDVAQTVLCNLISRPVIGLRSPSARAYMRTCIDRESARVKQRESQNAYLGPDAPGTGPSTIAGRCLLAADIFAEVGTMPTYKRTLVDLRYRKGLKDSEIAKITGRSAGAIRKDLSRIVEFLRRRFFV